MLCCLGSGMAVARLVSSLWSFEWAEDLFEPENVFLVGSVQNF